MQYVNFVVQAKNAADEAIQLGACEHLLPDVTVPDVQL